MTATAAPLFYSPEEAGRMLGCSGETVRQRVRRGEMKAQRFGRWYKIPRIEIERLLGHKTGPTEEELANAEKIREAVALLARATALLAEVRP